MNKILLIGAGNIGSRHLQGLKKVTFPLSIEVLDPSDESLKVSQERYEQIPSNITHQIKFINSIEHASNEIDLAIIATSSNVRADVTQKLLLHSKVKFIIFEKLLFQKKEDYPKIERLLDEKNIKAWVNCGMRTMPFYSDLKDKITDNRISCIVSGSRYGFITNTIHFIDYMAYLNDCYDFTLETKFLDKKPVESKRKEFLEFTGTLYVTFQNGDLGIFICYPDGEAPVSVEIINKDIKAMANETNRTTWLSTKPNWEWKKTPTLLSFQSDLTNIVVENILKQDACNLTSFKKSAMLHLTLLEGLKDFMNQSEKIDFYPFT